MSMSTPYVRAVLCALLVTFLWSTSWVLIKVGLRDLPVLTFAGLRYALALLCPFALPPRARAEWRALTRADLGMLVTLGVVQYALTQRAVPSASPSCPRRARASSWRSRPPSSPCWGTSRSERRSW